MYDELDSWDLVWCSEKSSPPVDFMAKVLRYVEFFFHNARVWMPKQLQLTNGYLPTFHGK